MFSIGCSILVTDELGHNGCTMCGIFTMEDQKRFGGRLDIEELRRQLFLVVEVDGSINVAALEFIFEPTVDNYILFVDMVELAVQNFDQSLFRDSRKVV